MKPGDLVTICRRWGSPYTLMAVKMIDEEPGFKIESKETIKIEPGDWTMLVKKFYIQTDPDNLYTGCHHYILLYDGRLWMYQVGPTSQSHIETKYDWDNPGWD